MNTMMVVLIAGGGIIFLLLVVGLVVSTREEKKFVENRVGRFMQDGQEAVASQGPQPSMLTEWMTNQATKFSWGQGLSRELARADLKLRVGEYIAVMVIVAFGVGFLAWFYGGKNIPVALIGAGVGFFLPRFYVGNQKNRRLLRFDQQLADMLNLMVNGLRAGYSTMQALEAVSKELPPPICDEFRRVVQEMQLGIPMERSLENLHRRIPSLDLDLVITAMNVQREVGGNLAEILDTISHTIRERVRIKGEIRVLTSQVMISGKFLAAMPIMLSFGLYFLNRPYMMNFFDPATRWLGIPALMLGAFMIFIGYLTMKKIADIQV
jgi:tight adherence protein B